MNVVKELDLAIKCHEGGERGTGYTVQDAPTDKALFDAYLTNEAWHAFIKEMKVQYPKAYTAFCKGGGGELEEKNGRPPKMASYGSSSRMIYLLSREHEQDGFQFEKKLPTTVGGEANLDGCCVELGRRLVFVEAKCHEPYSSKSTEVSVVYEPLYRYIHEKMPEFSCVMEDVTSEKKKGKYKKATFLIHGQALRYFDIKQMICHLLGIATGILNGTLDRETAKSRIDFLYLLYDPTRLSLPTEAKEQVQTVWQATCRECRTIDFSRLLRAIFGYLREKESDKVGTLENGELEQILCGFSFSLVSQEQYPACFH